MAQNSLPSFSGNYGNKGAYEDPKPALNDKSGQIEGNMYASLGKNIANSILQTKANQNKEAAIAKGILDENYKWGEDNQEKLLWQLGRSGIHNQSLHNLGNKIIDRRTKSRLNIKLAVNAEDKKIAQEEYNKATSQLGELLGMTQTLKDTMNTYVTDTNTSQVGNQGKMATTGKPYTNVFNAGMPALTGTANNAESEYYLGPNGEIRIKLSSDQITNKSNELEDVREFNKGVYQSGDGKIGPLGEDGGEEDISQFKNGYLDVNASVFLNFDPGKVPMVNKEINERIKELTDKNGNLKNDYVDTTIETNVNGFDITTNTLKEGSKMVINQALGGLRDSYLANPDMAQIIWKSVFNKNEDLVIADGKQTSTPNSRFDVESEEKWLEAWQQYVYGSEEVKNDKGEVITEASVGRIPQSRIVEQTKTEKAKTLTPGQELAENQRTKTQDTAIGDATGIIEKLQTGDVGAISAFLQNITIDGQKVMGNSIAVNKIEGPLGEGFDRGRILKYNTSKQEGGGKMIQSTDVTVDLDNPDSLANFIQKIVNQKGAYANPTMIMKEVRKILNPLLIKE